MSEPTTLVHLGYALVGDVGRFEISRMFLRDGLVWMIAESSVTPRFDGGKCMVRFFSPDGHVVGIVQDLPIPKWDLQEHPGTVHIEFSVRLESGSVGDPYMGIAETRAWA